MPIEVDMMLGEAATMQGGVLNVLGAGWQIRTPTADAMSAIGLVLKVPRKQLGVHQIRLELLNSEGTIVTVEPPYGPGPMVIDSTIAVGGLTDQGLKSPVLGAFAIQLPPFPLEEGQEYEWKLHVDGRTRPGWSLPFRTARQEELAFAQVPVPSLPS
jgi:hypothetical protein